MLCALQSFSNIKICIGHLMQILQKTGMMEKRVCSKLVSTENVPAPSMYYVPFLRYSFLLIPATCHCKTKYQQQHGCVCCSHFQMTHLPFTSLSLGLWPEMQILIKNVHADQLIFSLPVIWRNRSCAHGLIMVL